jgi:hypothetical protein
MSIVDQFLSDLGSALRVGRRYRARVVGELREHLGDAVEAHVAAGWPDPERLAIDAIGVPRVLADRFNIEAATRRLLRGPLWAAGAIAAVLGGVIVSMLGPARSADVAAPWFAQVLFFVAAVGVQVAVVAVCRGASLCVAMRRNPHPGQPDETVLDRSMRLAISATAIAAALWVAVLLSAEHRGALASGRFLVAGFALMAAGVVGAAVMMRPTRTAVGSEPREPELAPAGFAFIGERAFGFVQRHPFFSTVGVGLLAAGVTMLHAETTLSGSVPWGVAEIVSVVAGFVLLGSHLGLRNPNRTGPVSG